MVGSDKWGPWWQRAIRLPTRRLSLTVDLPTELQPSIWGVETSMTAESSPFRTPIVREERGSRTIFTWSTNDPPLHARYRIEWKFKAAEPGGKGTEMETTGPSAQMSSIGDHPGGRPDPHGGRKTL
jgi:hypothetical protein